MDIFQINQNLPPNYSNGYDFFSILYPIYENPEKNLKKLNINCNIRASSRITLVNPGSDLN
ncbi:hypothetical protein BpHYR1_041229 [Brachionus plicatilis]|uniref:Uncharacterized protein n=1 Tax=Brachionus plicatilis TaxID=10195 RepID=A0A3M7PQG4_BRAPC|nr:hypothetical protein BpHYR1_041229 [Brachionus plicatilis]